MIFFILSFIFFSSTLEAIQFEETVVRSHKEEEESVYNNIFLNTKDYFIPGYSLQHILSIGDTLITGGQTPGSLATVSIRGAGSVNSLVTIMGVPVNSAQNGVFDLSLLPLNFFNTVGIIKGGCSSIKGANASSGTATLFLFPKQEKNSLSLNLTKGIEDRTEFLLNSFIKISPLFGFSLNGFYHTSRNAFFYKFEDVPMIRTNAGNTNIALSSSLFFKKGIFSSDLHLIFSVKRTGIPGPAYPQNKTAHENDKMFFILSHNTFSFPLFTELDLSFISTLTGYTDIAVFSLHQTEQFWSKLAQTACFENFSIYYGIENRWNIIKSTQIGNKERFLFSPFFSFEIYKNSLKIILRTRVDINSTYGIVPSATGGIRLKLKDKVVFRSSLSKSFREPTFNDLYWPKDSFAKGNLKLKPEHSYNFDTGLEFYFLKWLYVQSTGFVCWYKDLIVWQEGKDSIWSPENFSSALYTGFEISGDINFSFFKLSGSFSHILPYNLTEGYYYGKFIPYVPFDRIGVTFLTKIRYFKLFLRYSWTGFSYTTKANTVSFNTLTNPFSSLDCGCEFEWKNIKISASGLNLLKRWDFTLYNQPVMGRYINIMIGYEIKFNQKEVSNEVN